MTIIEQIKAEIERRIKILREDEVVRQNCTSDFLEGKIYGYEELLSLLSTLESEKPMQEGLEEELDKWRHEHFHGKRDDHFSGEYLERTSQLDLARHFAQWQREQDEKEEADLFTIVALDAAQRAKEQMMKEAVEYEVWDFSSSLEACPHVNIHLDNKQYRNGDKVRVIVLPKEN